MCAFWTFMCFWHLTINICCYVLLWLGISNIVYAVKTLCIFVLAWHGHGQALPLPWSILLPWWLMVFLLHSRHSTMVNSKPFWAAISTYVYYWAYVCVVAWRGIPFVVWAFNQMKTKWQGPTVPLTWWSAVCVPYACGCFDVGVVDMGVLVSMLAVCVCIHFALGPNNIVAGWAWRPHYCVLSYPWPGQCVIFPSGMKPQAGIHSSTGACLPQCVWPF